MKPIYITMKFFGSYKDVTIDFSKINSGIFLITGDTGAGKTTIFDAITYALYGESSGGKRDGKMMISQFAAPNEFTEVIFCFKYGKNKYIVKRSPEQKRYKEKIDDNKNKIYEELKSLKKPTLELTMPDGSLFNGKMTEINQKIQDIIGIDASQFVQIAMLAQGDFLKLLHARSDERKTIFAKIFDTRLYGMIQRELENQFKNINTKLQNNENEIRKLLSEVVCAEGSNLLEIWKQSGTFSDDKSSEIFALIQSIIDEFNYLIERNEGELNKYKKEEEQIQKLLNEAKQINEDFEQLEQLKKEMENLQRKEKNIVTIKIKHINAQRATKVSESYNFYLDRKKELYKKTEEVNKRSIELAECNDRLESLYYKKLEIDEKYNQEFEVKTKELSLLEAKMSEFDEIEEEQKQYQLVLSKLKEKQNLQIDYKTKEDCIQNKVVALMKEVERYTKIAGQLESIKRKLDQFKRDKEDLDEFYLLLTNQEQVIKELKEQKIQYDKMQEKRQDIERRYNQLYKEFINKQAHIIRKLLVEGEPCPVCGSTHHDITSFEEVEVISEQEVENVKQQFDAVVREENRKREQLTFIQLQEKENNKQINKYKIKSKLCKNSESSKSIQIYIERTKTAIQELEQQRLQSLEAEKSLEIKNQDLETVKEQLKEIQDYTKQLDIDMASIKSQTSEMKKALAIKERRLPFATKKEAQENFLEMKQYKDELERNKKENDTNYQQASERITELQAIYLVGVNEKNELIEREEEAERIFFDNLTKNKFLNEQDFLKSRMSDEEAEQLKNEITEYEQTVQNIDFKIKLFLERTKDKKYIDITNYSEKKKEIEDLTKKLQDEGKDIYTGKKVNQKAYSYIKEQYKERESLKKQYVILKNLNDTANGKLSRKKIDFQTYIQRRYFKKVIAAANMRLIKMTNNQFCLRCRELESLGTVGNVGLDLDVYSIVGDQIRDVKTLSGGESFMASLCMALGLSDIIQNKAGKIQIQTMFIDEGFGTLSEDARNQALEILNELSGNNILIGIISHIKELREQVDTKLIVTKTKDGSEAVWKM